MQPDLLIIMSDQHSGRVMHCAGDPLVNTPNLDRLASEGVRFDHTYCGNPLCVPSRMTFLTSQHSSDIRVWTNMCVLGSDVPTFAHSLAAAGYETVLCGRMHFCLADHRHGFETHLVGDVTPQWPGLTGPDLGDIPLSTTGQQRPGLETAGPGRTAYQAYDRAVTDAAVEFLRTRSRTPERRPFCLVVGHVLPHCPFICPKPLFDHYLPLVDVPRQSEGEDAYRHPAVQAWRERRGLIDVPDETVRTARAAYYGLVEHYDALIGEIVGAVDENGQADRTAVFYTSDHGDMAGKQEMWWKSSFYEDSVGVPLLARWPGTFARGRVVNAPVSLLDLAPTFLELGKGRALPDARGQSLLPALQSGDDTTEPTHPVFAEACSEKDPPSRMIRRGPWKLVHHDGYDEPQLFNLSEDPSENCDRARDPGCAETRDELLAQVLDGWSADAVRDELERRRDNWGMISEWAKAAAPPEPDHWPTPQGCNIFPETV